MTRGTQIIAWRIVAPQFAGTPLDGTGAALVGGRFNGRHRPMAYTSESISLALLEILVQAGRRSRLQNYVCVPVRFRESHVETLAATDLPLGWNTIPYHTASQEVGDRWLREHRSAVLRVPSVVVPQENNYLINPRHSRFEEIEAGEPIPAPVDARFPREL